MVEGALEIFRGKKVIFFFFFQKIPTLILKDIPSRLNVIIAGGYVAKALGLTTKFGENIVDKFRNNTKTYSGDIDIFMGSSVYKRILELRRAQAVMTVYDDDIDFGKLRMYSRSSYFGREVAEVADIQYNETRTNVKVSINSLSHRAKSANSYFASVHCTI